VSPRVLQVIPSVSPVHGGPSSAIRAIERGLLHTHWSFETATTDDDGRGKRVTRRTGALVEDEGAPRWYFRKSTEFYKVSWSFVPWILREVRRYDVVHIHALFSFTSLAAGWAARRTGVPYVIRPLGVLNRYGMRSRRPWLKRLSLRLLEAPLLRGAAAVQFTSELEQKEALSLRIPMRPVIVPLAVAEPVNGDPEHVRAAWPAAASKPCVLYLSRLDPVKNLESLLRAIAQLNRPDWTVTLLVAGSGEAAYVRQLHELARSEGIEDSVVWLGHVTGETKASALSLATLFVLPSFSENFGVAVLEALASGLPCVVGRGVGMATAVESAGAGLAVNPDPDSIAVAIRKLLESQALRAAASSAARHMVEQEYSLEVLGRRLAGLYDAVRSSAKTKVVP
jgi:glycosyltransferase involved in cell wall biosynthesis